MLATTKGKLIRAEQVAAIIGVSPRLASNIMRQMPRVNIGSSVSNPRWAVYESDVQAWITQRQAPAETPGQPRRTRKRATVTNITNLDDSGHIMRRR